ncbi:hypothetical protein [Streptomyces europaeiscabiei]|uniref:hypothetical protein n=1 Tax=Streptomyces europaeiscabiei TaxID=146819 RepID=UPI0038F81813
MDPFISAASVFATEAAHANAWAWGWDALVALGTLLLALGTAGLAAFTASLASRTRQLASDAEADLRAQWRPLLLPAQDVEAGGAFSWENVSQILGEEQPVGDLVVHVSNVGRGPALHVRVQLEADGTPGSISPENWAVGAMAHGEVRKLKFTRFTWHSAVQVLFDYRDLAGRYYSTAVVITAVKREPQFYDVRLWEDHTVTTLGDAVYPQDGLRDVSPKQH